MKTAARICANFFLKSLGENTCSLQSVVNLFILVTKVQQLKAQQLLLKNVVCVPASKW